MEWQKTKSNIGYHSEGLKCPEDSTKQYPLHILYKISTGSGVQIIEDADPTIQYNTHQGYQINTPLMILSYDNGGYAAMLPL
jgi:hypothetical protein